MVTQRVHAPTLINIFLYQTVALLHEGLPRGSWYHIKIVQTTRSLAVLDGCKVLHHERGQRRTLRYDHSQHISNVKNHEEDCVQQPLTILSLSFFEEQKDEATVVCGH